MPLSGCVYAVAMDEDAHPDIRDNAIYLTKSGNRGILEEDDVSYPTALLRNHFYSPLSSAELYIARFGATSAAAAPERSTNLGRLNALADVPEVGGNTFTHVSTAP
jgi:hypothetical protein